MQYPVEILRLLSRVTCDFFTFKQPQFTIFKQLFRFDRGAINCTLRHGLGNLFLEVIPAFVYRSK